jgi:hypothetical protein
MVILNLSVCLKLLYKVCGQSYHYVIIKKLHKGRANFWTLHGCPPPPLKIGACKEGQYQRGSESCTF